MSILPSVPGVAPPTEQMRELEIQPDQIRKYTKDGSHPGIRQRLWGLEARLDPSVTFEEYTYWANIEREMEQEEERKVKAIKTNRTIAGIVKAYFTKQPYEDEKIVDSRALQSYDEDLGHKQEKTKQSLDVGEGTTSPIPPSDTHDFDAEWRTAARALRTATWGGIFYLITTDILGWGQTPYVFANTGYGLGVGIFVLMGIAAAFSGWMIWKTFMSLDSSRFPMLSYGDPFFRLYGTWARHTINILQALDMFLTVAVLQLGQTGIIAQLAGNVNLCFIVCAIISLVVGMASGYMRSLRHIGWFCNASVWINVVTFIIICVAAAKFGPDPTAAVNNGILPKSWALPGQMEPVRVFIDTPPPEYQQSDTDLFAAQFNGINSMVYAYSGALFFVAFLAEMRQPADFWKAMFLAQAFIAIVYIFFGAFTYTYYGQYSYVVINQVVKPLGLQIVGNVLSLITGWLAIFLYFNIGMKTIYLEVGEGMFGLPPITTRKGKLLWWGLGPVYWILAFVVAMSVPQFTAFTNFIGAISSLNLTYSFSGVMFLGHTIQHGARLAGEGFDPATGNTVRHDDGMKRWWRGFAKTWYISLPALVYTLAGLAACGMGTWAAILALEAAFGPAGSVLTSWTCTNPYYIPPGAGTS